MKKLGFDLILLGDSTSGKDTQALLLAKKYDVKLGRSGEFLRKYKPQQYVSGAPAPTKLILPFLNDCLKGVGKKDLIFVGAARLKPEAEHLVKQLNSKKRNFFAIYIKLPAQEIIKRSLLRAAREEDTDKTLINKRIKYYKEQVSKTVDYYRQMKKLKFVDGKQSIKKVNQDIEKIIHDYQRSQTN